MKTSERTGELLVALLKARASFQPIAKTKHVTVTTKAGRRYDFDYAPLEVIQAATDPSLWAEGLQLCSGVQPGPDGTVEVVTRLLHTSEQWMESRVPWGTFEDMKALGGFVSYARRYNHLALLDLAGEDDVDGSQATGDHIEPRVNATAVPASSNGHQSALEASPSTGLHPTEAHMDAIEQLVTGPCGADVEELHDRLRHTLGLKPGASTAKRLMMRVLSMEQYMQVFAHFTKVAEQLAKSRQEGTRHGAQPVPSKSAASTATAAPTAEEPPAPPRRADATEAGPLSASAPAPDPGDTVERERIVKEAMDAGIPEKEARHICSHHDLKAAERLLLAAAKKRLQAAAA